MIEYHGNELYTVYLDSGRKLELTEYDLIEFYKLFQEHIEKNQDRNIYQFDSDLKIPESPQRKYNKREEIIDLYYKYKNPKRTKADVFRKISKELEITYKAVEKAFYKKR